MASIWPFLGRLLLSPKTVDGFFTSGWKNCKSLYNNAENSLFPNAARMSTFGGN